MICGYKKGYYRSSKYATLVHVANRMAAENALRSRKFEEMQGNRGNQVENSQAGCRGFESHHPLPVKSSTYETQGGSEEREKATRKATTLDRGVHTDSICEELRALESEDTRLTLSQLAKIILPLAMLAVVGCSHPGDTVVEPSTVALDAAAEDSGPKPIRSLTEPVIGPVDFYVGDGVDLDAAIEAVEWINGTAGYRCLYLIQQSWDGPRTPGVVSIEIDDEAVGDAWGISWHREPGEGKIRLPSWPLPQPAVTITHEILHTLLDVGDSQHADDGGVFDNVVHSEWTLPDWHTERLQSFCETRQVPALNGGV